MKLSIRPNSTIVAYALTLTAQTLPEQPVGLVLKSESGKLLRAKMSLELTAKVGDILFTGDSLRSGGAEASGIDQSPGADTVLDSEPRHTW